MSESVKSAKAAHLGSGGVRCCVFDLDGTLVGKPDAMLDFAETWQGLDPSGRPVLCYNTGRLLEDALRLVGETRLPKPDFLICGVGTVIFDCGSSSVLKAFSEILSEGWNLSLVNEILAATPQIVRQPEHFQTAFKSSWYLYDAAPEVLVDLQHRLEAAGLEVSVAYSSARDLDILPKCADKGSALEWLLREIGVAAAETVVAGDTGNDLAMFQLPGVRGILLENAQPELLEGTVGGHFYRSPHTCAEGVLDGLLHYGVIRGILRREESTVDLPMDPAIRRLFEGEGIVGADASTLSYLDLAYGKAVEGLRRCITPMGFSACSIADNETRGTDENYYSVWARDGAIAVMGSLGLKDTEIRTCQKQTLETLLLHMSAGGQIPANVQINTGQPDYSGVGGIASIDSGLWVVIAVSEYVRATRDVAFAREHLGRLQRAMDWLSAHDSNRDALLEIPEAGDWMDLFNRSYNVLVDEVIWYRANVAYGRLLEIAGQFARAREYLVWSESIRRAILGRFWPSTQAMRSLDKRSFTEVQYSVGDASYLLAQVTPFGFDWRCDVYGNILAFLFNVLDVERARVAFRFMWGCGVNVPYPVANLYPVITPGDPDWRSYYTVNMLNLPHHYHNGGLWPFVGAQWVRFVNRLGMRDVAVSELVKLAELNQKGVRQEWEFNEWAHGVTGRPMGKAFQAWSCAEFIAACHETLPARA